MNIEEKAKEIKRVIIDMAHRSKSPHVGSCLSAADMLAALYFGKLKLDPWEERDIFILSKAHAAMSLYATLFVRGIIPRETIDGYYKNEGTLPAHLDRFTAKGVETSGGSLGHGFNIGLGIAFAFKKKKSDRKVYALIGDGESQEGSIWEGALFAPKLGLDNFTAILDYNNLQGYGRARDLCSYEPVADKWRAFGWNAVEADGNDIESVLRALDEPHEGKPKIIIAKTTKGKGVSFMEDKLIWHYYMVQDEHRDQAMEELR